MLFHWTFKLVYLYSDFFFFRYECSMILWALPFFISLDFIPHMFETFFISPFLTFLFSSW